MKTVLHEWKASVWDFVKKVKLVFLQKSEFQIQGISIKIGLFGIISLSISQNDVYNDIRAVIVSRITYPFFISFLISNIDDNFIKQ